MLTPHLPNGLARAAVRFRPSSFVGTFVALLMAAAIVSACGILLQTGLTASVPADRYAKAPVLVAADQQASVTSGRGDEAYESTAVLPDTARLPESLVKKAAAVPGAAAAIGDRTFPVQQHRTPLTAHGWGSTAFTGTELVTGDAPRTGEVVIGSGIEGRVGDTLTLDTPAGPHEFRVSGTTATDATLWFTDRQAGTVSGHPGRVDAIVVLAAPGTTAHNLAAQVGRAMGTEHAAQVHTGDDRGGVEDPGLASAEELLVGLGGSFGGIAAMVAVFTAAGTVALSVGQRGREFALLRAIGATPRQLRRTIATESLLVAPLAGALGTLPGIALANWWFGRLKDKGAIPDAVRLDIGWLPLGVAVAATVLTALLAGYLAARRPAKTKPGLALARTAVEGSPFGRIRTPLGVVALAGGGVFAGIAASQTGEDAANAALGVVMLFMMAVALLGPVIARVCASVLGLPLRAAGASGALAAANSRTNARRLASAITPIVLAMAFSSTLVFMHTSENRAVEHQQRDGITADHIVSDPAGLASDATARAAATPGVSTAVGLVRSSVLVPSGGSSERYLATASAQGVIGSPADLGRVQDLDVRTGTLDALRPGTIAIDTTLAASAKVATGDRLALHLPDGTKASPKVVAVYGRGLGISLVTLPAADLKGHVTSPYASDVLVRATPAAAGELGALGTVTDSSGYAATQNQQRELSAWANTVMAAVLGGFAAVAAVNTLVMTVLDRRRELTVLRLVGSTRRQVMGMIRWEALLVTGAGIALGTGIALATLVPMMKGLTGEAPYIPPMLYGSFAAVTVLLGLGATAIPARAALR
ncbi:FtsX-like permease family protein [Streptomyces sp. BE308]|uniref:ABC transporter permease n=1 Tax=Streptomyces sp. BE308 TaxID=3002529 RepID=UPI002E78F1CE|nr:FtsX-like permease family protein [Streptomyces sp. BE308]MEE1792010.1 FtsX-like permease family protein [Streptomyces sp. BE308]